MSDEAERQLQARMYDLNLHAADREYAEIQHGGDLEMTRSESSPLGIVRVLLRRDGPWFRRYSNRDQVALARYVWFSMTEDEQSQVRRRSTRRPGRDGWEFPWTLVLPRRLAYVFPQPDTVWLLFRALYCLRTRSGMRAVTVSNSEPQRLLTRPHHLTLEQVGRVRVVRDYVLRIGLADPALIPRHERYVRPQGAGGEDIVTMDDPNTARCVIDVPPDYARLAVFLWLNGLMRVFQLYVFIM